jgi:hypothetical protein
MIDNKLLQKLGPKFSNWPTHSFFAAWAMSIIIPTKNETKNIESLLSRIDRATREFQWRGYLLMRVPPTIRPVTSEVLRIGSL